MDAVLRRRLRRRLDDLLDRGWNGCRCACHGGSGSIKHFLPCCSPDHEELVELVERLLQEREFASLLNGAEPDLLLSEAMMLAHIAGKRL